ncbi:MAG: DUF692 domain-containing protein [Gammaproteobacteria bacterium]|nr:MAG: DUF692 domain-containing protein [Gammaproteobacteria bacterium]
MNPMDVQGAGLGLRRSLLPELLASPHAPIDYLEVAPENWIGVGGRLGRQLAEMAERYPLTLHGLSLDIGGPRPLDTELLDAIALMMQRFQCPLYSEHLTACGDDGHLYDLMPIPFTEEAVRYVASRIRQVQDRLGCRIAMENASYYASLGGELSEAEFIRAVLQEADCDLLLDVNNIVVNSINHGYDARDFLLSMPADRVVAMHVAGHYVEAEDLRVDTHGADVIDPVWDLLAVAYRHVGVKPTLLERDFNIPPLPDLLAELGQVKQIQHEALAASPRLGVGR